MTDHDWTEHPFRKDPLTQRMICFDCWHHQHGSKEDERCLVTDCKCACYEEFAAKAEEQKLRRQRSRQRKKALRAALEDESNPLRAHNPEFRGARG